MGPGPDRRLGRRPRASRATEQFAYVGTQLADVDPRLDGIYARFLDDRQVVVASYTATRSVLSDRLLQQMVQEQILASLESEGSAADIAAQRAVVDSLAADVASLQDQLAVTDCPAGAPRATVGSGLRHPAEKLTVQHREPAVLGLHPATPTGGDTAQLGTGGVVAVDQLTGQA